MQGSARKDVVFGAARVYTMTLPGPKWKSWLKNVVQTPSKIKDCKLLRVFTQIRTGCAWNHANLLRCRRCAVANPVSFATWSLGEWGRLLQAGSLAWRRWQNVDIQHFHRTSLRWR